MEVLAQHLIQAGLQAAISDIHILPLEKGYEVYFRRSGRLELYKRLEDSEGRKLISYFKFSANMDVGEKRQPQSGSANMVFDDDKVELRFSTITNVLLKESMVIRLLKQSQGERGQVGTYFPGDLATLEALVRRKSGLILFSGPVGSGKTTTIYQLLRQRIDREPIQVITMEDPVEIYEERFLQTEVNEAANITYDLLIKSSLRHHPDILLIGEIRDEDTARMAIRGALTGHLMIATIHAKNALGVIARLQELGVSQEQLRQTLIGIISQRLLPRKCPLCEGPCHRLCKHLSQEHKRSALLEILAGPSLKAYLKTGETPGHIDLNHKLRKVWSYGYIDTESFTHFELV